MDKEKEYTPKDGIRSIYLALYFIGAVLSGAGGNYLFMRSVGPETMAPDRFTGTQASALISRINHIESLIDLHTAQHPDISNQYDRRIAVLESQYEIIIKNQDRIILRLDNGR